jgi:hypothetical protein
MMTKQMTLWGVVDYMCDHLPLRREKIETLFKIMLEKSEASNELWTFWEGVGGVLLNDVNISSILLGVKNNEETNIGALTLNIVDSCIKYEHFKNIYNLQILGSPRGHSLDEETIYESITSWGSLVFGFAERNRDCLSSVGIGVRK